MFHKMSLYACRVLSLTEAMTCLREGGLVIYPTETFMGVGCDACNADAVARVYQAKRRSVQLPLPTIVSEVDKVGVMAVFEPLLRPLTERFWPGPLTVLLPARATVPPMLTGGTGRVAVRVSSHPIAHMLSGAVEGGLVSSSANISGLAAVTQALKVDPCLMTAVDGIVIEGPEPAGGAPSTLVELVEPIGPGGPFGVVGPAGQVGPVGVVGQVGQELAEEAGARGGPALRVLRQGCIGAEQLAEAGYRIVN